ncbi:MAG: ABC transporter ATP-binding protein [Gemmatimonadota bacterium]
MPDGLEREILVAERLKVLYGAKVVLDLERVALREGELLAILGPNGAGKSTLLRVLAMLEKPTSGRIRYRGRSGRSAERTLREKSAAVFQRPHLWRDTVAYNVGLGLRLRGAPQGEVLARVRRVCEQLEILELLQQDVQLLSGGQAQRVALARALVLDPEILFLDEPTANLDAQARAELRADLERTARERAGSIVLITHDRNEAFTLADRVLVLVDGKPVQSGAPTELYENPADPYIAQVTGAILALRGVVLGSETGLLVVDIGPLTLQAVGTARRGERVKIAYRPEDLVLTPAGEPSGHLSTRNCFFATVQELRSLGSLVRIRLTGPPEMVAVVTQSAARELDLQPGHRVSIRVKATALRAFPL